MRVTKASVVRACAICERTLLMGEHTVRFSPDGEEFVDVCPLCNDIALDHGWVREGLPLSPALQLPCGAAARCGRRCSARGRSTEQPVVEEPLLRRLSDDEVAMVEAAELFNASAFLRTVNGVAKALGEPQVSIMPLSGVTGEMVLTFAWDISWYQYRVTPTRASRSGSPSAATTWTSSMRRSPSGTPASSRRARHARPRPPVTGGGRGKPRPLQ